MQNKSKTFLRSTIQMAESYYDYFVAIKKLQNLSLLNLQTNRKQN